MTVSTEPRALLAVLADVAERLSAEPGIATINEVVLPVVATVLGAQVASLVLREPGDTLRVAATAGISAHVFASWSDFHVHAAVPLAAAVREARPIWVPDIEAAREQYPALPPCIRSRSLCSIPLRSGPEVIGGLGLGWDEQHDFNDGEQQMLVTAAGLTAAAIASSRLRHDGTGNDGVGHDGLQHAGLAPRLQQSAPHAHAGAPALSPDPALWSSAAPTLVGRFRRTSRRRSQLHVLDGDGTPLCGAIDPGAPFDVSEEVWDEVADADRCQGCRLLLGY